MVQSMLVLECLFGICQSWEAMVQLLVDVTSPG